MEHLKPTEQRITFVRVYPDEYLTSLPQEYFDVIKSKCLAMFMNQMRYMPGTIRFNKPTSHKISNGDGNFTITTTITSEVLEVEHYGQTND